MNALIIETAGEPSFRVSLGTEKLRIGRSKSNEICLSADSAVSRFHAEIVADGEHYFVSDVGSHNGTFVNGRPVETRTPLYADSCIQIGNTVIRLSNADVTSDGIRLPAAESVDDDEDLSGNSVILSASQIVGAGAVTDGTIAGLSPESESPRARAFAALSAWAPDLMSPNPLPEVLNLVMKMVYQAIAPERAALLLLEDAPKRLTLCASRGMQPGADSSEYVSTTIANRVMERGQSVLTSDAQADPRFMDAQSIVLQSVQSAMSVPLYNNKDVIGMIYVDTTRVLASFSKVDLEVLTLLANLSAIKIDHVRLAERDQKMRELERELQAAAQIQRKLLPAGSPEFEGYDIYGRNDPCHQVGGDYFDFQMRDDDNMGIAVGDVSGKGMGAALLMATLQASFRAHAASDASTETLVERLNRSVCSSAEADKFITFFYAELERETGRFRYVNAGHNPPMLLRADGTVERLHSGGLILGFLPTTRYNAKETSIAPGDLLLLFTDGVTESQDADGQEYGEERLDAVIRATRQLPGDEIVQRIRVDVDAFTGDSDPYDDFTVCTVRRLN